MSLPSNFIHHREWILLGPMGPELSGFLSHIPVIAVDGGAHFAQRLDLWIGDADSFKGKIDSAHCLKFPPEKDLSDLALALSLLNQDHSYYLHLWGFLGGRHDHELFNLGEAAKFLEQHSESRIALYDQQGIKRFDFLSKGSWQLSIESLFSLGSINKVKVELSGCCKYPITPASDLDPLSSRGLSNEGHGEVQITTDGPVFIYYPELK